VPHTLRIALRSLLRTPFLYFCAVVAIGLGIAARVTAPGHAELESVAAAVHADHPDWTEGVGYRAQRYSHAMLDSDDGMILRVMLVLFSFVLIVACANVANLLLARASGRRTRCERHWAAASHSSSSVAPPARPSASQLPGSSENPCSSA
jgi:hypothetical protein